MNQVFEEGASCGCNRGFQSSGLREELSIGEARMVSSPVLCGHLQVNILLLLGLYLWQINELNCAIECFW